MPITYRIDSESGLLSAKGLGTLTDADVAGFVSELLADPEFPHATASLVDFTEAKFGVASEHIPALARLHRELLSHGGPPRVAVVVPGDLNFGLARMYAQHLSPSGPEVRPFRDEAEARAWLRGDRQGEGT
jgi:hypothetical protein